MNAPVEPPPLQEGTPKRKFVPRYNTAMLLGAMAILAVVCTMAMSVPYLVMAILATTSLVAQVVFLGFFVAGAWLAHGRQRLFALAVLASLTATFWGGETGTFATVISDWMGWSRVSRAYILSILMPVQQMALALLGGWIALRAAHFWEVKSADSSELHPPVE